MRLLWISTKAPWPSVDGGRLLQLLTLRELARHRVEMTLVAPVDPRRFDRAEVVGHLSEWADVHLVRAAPVRFPGVLWRAFVQRLPLAVARHAQARVRRRVEGLLAAGSFDAAHVEQLHAWPQAAPAVRRGLPVVLRAQNVESDLWEAAALLPSSRGRLLRWQAARLRPWEGRAVAAAAATVALSRGDAERLAALARGVGSPRDVLVHRPPFPAELPAAEAGLPGRPAVVLLASSGWLPNRDSISWFLEEIWPVVRRSLPRALLHLYSPVPPPSGHVGVVLHPPPRDSRDAFAPGSVLVVPLRLASGVRMRILEAWARGVPVVATPQGAAGLDVEDERELLLAVGPTGFATALERLAREEDLPRRLAAAGRRRLVEQHDPSSAAEALEEVYRRVTAGDRARVRSAAPVSAG